VLRAQLTRRERAHQCKYGCAIKVIEWKVLTYRQRGDVGGLSTSMSTKRSRVCHDSVALHRLCHDRQVGRLKGFVSAQTSLISNTCAVQESSAASDLLPPLHDLDTHVLQTIFGLSRRKVLDRGYSLISILLSQCSRLLDTIALDNKIACLPSG